MLNYLLVALGGALGSVSRFWFSGLIAERFGATFPLGTLCVNVTGSFIIENVFSIPGIGRIFVQGIGGRDYALIMGAVLFYALIVALANLAVDLIYGVLDPRIRYS